MLIRKKYNVFINTNNRFCPSLCIALLCALITQAAPAAELGSQLTQAAECGNADEIQALLSKISQTSDPLKTINLQNKWGDTALHLATQKKFSTIAQMLLNAGAAPDSQSKIGITPLHWAARNGLIDTVQNLLTQGADPNIQDVVGNTAVFWAASGNQVNVVDVLLDEGAAVVYRDKTGKQHNLVDHAKNNPAVRRLLKQRAKAQKLPLSQELPPIAGRFSVRLPDHEPLSPYDDSDSKHYPILFLIDQQRQGGISFSTSPDSDVINPEVKIDFALRALYEGLAYDYRPIIASRELTCGVLALAQTRSLKYFIKHKWHLYNVPESPFTIWMPKRLEEYFKPIFRIGQADNSMIKLTTDSKEAILSYCPPAMVHKDDPRIHVQDYKKENLFKIFKVQTPEEGVKQRKQVLDIILAGHGATGVAMAGLPISQNIAEDKRITSLLSFLNNQVPTGTVYIISCGAGGQNAALVQTERLGIPLNYNYILIIGSATDKLNFAEKTGESWKMNRFFEEAARLKANGNLEGLLKGVIHELPATADIHGYAAFPQVWLPGGTSFQTFNINKDVLIAGTVLLTTREQEPKGKRAINIIDKKVILWYPPVITVPISIGPTKRKQIVTMDIHHFIRPPKKIMTAAETLDSLPVRSGQLAADIRFRKQTVQQSYPQLTALFEQEINAENNIRKAVELFYPEFVAMGKREPRRLWFKDINLPDINVPQFGILQFLRDAFCDVMGDASQDQKEVVIDLLQGRNDFPIQMETARWAEGINATALPFELLMREAGQQIQLKDTVILINHPQHPGKLVIFIKYNDKYWSCAIDLEGEGPLPAWQFQQSAEPPLATFKQALRANAQRPTQKTLSQILEASHRKAVWPNIATALAIRQAQISNVPQKSRLVIDHAEDIEDLE